MKKKVLIAVISGKLKNIKKSCNKIMKHSREEDIHKLRVEVKKLRAFLRMISLELKDPGKLRLPGEIKKVYSKAGEIRDIHLHLQRVEKAIPEENEKPANYFFLFGEKTAKNERQLARLLSKRPVSLSKKKIIKQLPGSVSMDTIHKFLQQKMIAIGLLVLSSHKTDEALHSTRKNLKDLMYDANVLKDEGKHLANDPMFEPGRLEKIDKLTQKLGDFNDLRLAATFIKPEFINEMGESEKNQLLAVKQQWIQDKELLKQEALQHLDEFYKSTVKVNDKSGEMHP